MNGTLHALALALIHFCWQATLIFSLYILVDLCFKKASSQARYLLALVALSLICMVFMVTLGYEAVQSPVAPGPSVDSYLRSSGVSSSVSTIFSKVASANAIPVGLRWPALLPWLDGVWLIGVISLSVRSFRGWLWLQRLRRVTIERAPKAIQARFENTCAKLGLKRLPELRVSQIISGPMTIGVLRTLVLLPTSALLALSPEQLEAVFAHELAHVRRADYFWNLLQTLAETLFFFHPVVWWLGTRLREQRELCCDDIATETCTDPLVYATALFQLEDQRSAGPALAVALTGHQSQVTFHARILRILGETSPQSHNVGLRPFSLLAVCTSLLVLLSPLPKTLGVAAQNLPVKRILTVPKEIASAVKRTAIGSTHRPSAPHTPGADRHGADAQFSPLTTQGQAAVTPSSTTEAVEYDPHRRIPKIQGKLHAVHNESTPDQNLQMFARNSNLEAGELNNNVLGYDLGSKIPKVRGKVHAVHKEHPPDQTVQPLLK